MPFCSAPAGNGDFTQIFSLMTVVDGRCRFVPRPFTVSLIDGARLKGAGSDATLEIKWRIQ